MSEQTEVLPDAAAAQPPAKPGAKKPKKEKEMTLDALLIGSSKIKEEGDVCGMVTEIDLEAKPEIFSTGNPDLDALLGGGLHWGRLTEIFGPNKSGKTELSRSIAASVLTEYDDSEVWYFDQEFALSAKILAQYPAFRLTNAAGKKRFRPITVSNLENFFILMYQAMNMLSAINTAGKTKKKIVFVLDSLPALNSKSQVNNEEFEKTAMLSVPRIWSDELSKLRRYLSHVGGHLIIVNQTRDKPGTPSYVDPESPGGQAVKFYADYRFYLNSCGKFSFSKGRTIPPGTRSSGFFTSLTVRKNKTGLPDRRMELVITFTPALGKPSGVSPEWTLFYLLLAAKIIKSKAGKFHLPGQEAPFNRIDWVAMYDEQRPDPESPLSLASKKWITSQLANDAGGSDDDDDDEGEEGAAE